MMLPSIRLTGGFPRGFTGIPSKDLRAHDPAAPDNHSRLGADSAFVPVQPHPNFCQF
jgi:hypothetical protein